MTVWRAYLEFCEAHPLPPAVNATLTTSLLAVGLIVLVLAATSEIWR